MIGRHRANTPEPRHPVGQFRRRHQFVNTLLRQIRQLELNEQKLGADLRAGLANRLVMTRDIGICRVGGKFELRVAGRLAKNLENAFIFGNQRCQLRAISLGKLSTPGIAKPFRGIARGGDIGCDGRIGNIAVEVRKVPDGAAVWHDDSLAELTGRRRFWRLRGIWGYGPPAASQKRCGSTITPICLHKRASRAYHCDARYKRGESVATAFPLRPPKEQRPRKLSGTCTPFCEHSGKRHGSAHRRGKPPSDHSGTVVSP